MPTEGPSTRQKERKDPDQTSGNLVLEIRALTATIDALKLSFEQQLDSKVDSLRDSVQLMICLSVVNFTLREMAKSEEGPALERVPKPALEPVLGPAGATAARCGARLPEGLQPSP
uniref:Uncharacterized protein n=1 Tax=Knipowitschia caucasica TaxID=637954 RepID=A0AAV2KG16_KNICA